MSEWIVGVLVGGMSVRMGRPKGLLAPPDGSAPTLVERTFQKVAEALPSAPAYLVGENPEYAGFSWPVLADAAPSSGPLGGIVALLELAEKNGALGALVVACDLPHLSAELVRRLAVTERFAPCLCPWVDERHQPLFARYSVDLLPTFQAALQSRKLALQPLVRDIPATVLVTSAEEQRELLDWDTPEDLERVL